MFQFLNAALIRCITVLHILRKGLHNSQAPGRTATKFCMVVPNNFSIITVVFFSHKNACQFTCTEHKAPGNTKVHRSLKFTVHSRIADPKHGTNFISACWRLEFGGVPLSVGKSVHPRLHAQALFFL
jgi:hypothetical protein